MSKRRSSGSDDEMPPAKCRAAVEVVEVPRRLAVVVEDITMIPGSNSAGARPLEPVINLIESGSLSTEDQEDNRPAAANAPRNGELN